MLSLNYDIEVGVYLKLLYVLTLLTTLHIFLAFHHVEDTFKI
jgi:hypothetical protein